MTLASTVREAARRFGERPVYVAAGGWTLTYGELDALSDEVAAGLATRHGIGAGDLVALVLPSTPDYAVAYAALAKLGAITAGVNPRYTAPERAAVVGTAHPDLVVTTAELAEGLPAGTATVVVRPATSAEDLLLGLRDAAPTVPALDDPDDPDDPERLVAVVFTSGTTGQPKGAMFGNRELAAIVRADLGPAADDWGMGGHMTAPTEFAHVGYMTKLPTWFRMGTTMHLQPKWRAGETLRLIHDFRMASVGGVAPQVALLLRHPDFDSYDFSCVKTIVMGGAASPPALVREAKERFGAAYSIRYSSTESGGIGLGTAFDADDEEALFTIGRPRAQTEAEVRDDEGRPVEQGEVGELHLRSPYMMRGYWRDDAATAATIVDGWIRTGDLARIDERGLFRLAGRKKEMFIRGGYNVYPMEVEAVLASHPQVAAVAVVPRPDPVMGELGVAVVVPADTSAPPTLDDLRAFAAERLAPYKLPEALRLVDELPLTAMQKIDRAALAAHETTTA
jgi:acyl-CoA synthetase (AMP-forming)/AMP-acid ligase II